MAEVSVVFARALTRDQRAWQLPLAEAASTLAGAIRRRISTTGQGAKAPIGPRKPWKLYRTGVLWAGLRVRNPAVGRAVVAFRGSHGSLSNSDLARILQGKAAVSILEPAEVELAAFVEQLAALAGNEWVSGAPEVVARGRIQAAEAKALRRSAAESARIQRAQRDLARLGVTIEGGGA